MPPSRLNVSILTQRVKEYTLSFGGILGDMAPLQLTAEEMLGEPPDTDPVVDSIVNLIEAYANVERPALVTPRLARVRQAGLNHPSYWLFCKGRRNNTEFMRFLGMPVAIFDVLCYKLRRYLKAFDPKYTFRGVRAVLKYDDVIAVCLRRLQLMDYKWMDIMEIEFSRNASVLARAIKVCRPLLLKFLRSVPAGHVGRPPKEEAELAWQGVISQHGEPPWYQYPELRKYKIFEGTDGTTTDVLKPGNQHLQASVHGHKGHCWNHVLVTHICGLIVDYNAVVKGSFQDSRLSDRLVQRQQKYYGTGMAAYDNGWKYPLYYPLPDSHSDRRRYKPGQVLRARPMMEKEYVPSELKDYYERCSAYVTVVRQHGEMMNGGFKRCFPVLLRPTRVQDKKSFQMDFSTVRT
jgi:hypothetical protein